MTTARYRQYLTERYQILLGYTGRMVGVIGVLNLVPLVLLAFYPEEARQALGFAIAGVPLMVLGYWLRRRYSLGDAITLNLQESAVIVVAVWLVAILSGAIPFIVNMRLTFIQAIFESTSGWTTTGLSVVDVTTAPQLMLFYRSFVQLAGGAGFAIIALTALAGSVAAGFMTAEGRTDQLAPHVRQTAVIVVRIYTGYTVFGVVALRLAGMNWFDAVNHAFTAVATGGFSTRPDSIGYWDSPAVEAVLIVLMLLGAINFLTAYTFMRGRFQEALRSEELKFSFALGMTAIVLMVSLVTLTVYPTLGKSVRVAMFEVISALTTTGFSTVSYTPWVELGWILLIACMLAGGGSGSTAGGLKQFRVYIMLRAIIWEVRQAFLPPNSVNEPVIIWQGNRHAPLTDQQVRKIAIFGSLYTVVYLVGTAILVGSGQLIGPAAFEFASVLAGVGLSVGVTSPDLSAFILWVMCMGMLLGRLEFFVVLIGAVKLVVDGRAFFDSVKIREAVGERNHPSG